MPSNRLPLLTASGVGRYFSKLNIFRFSRLKPHHGYSPGGEAVGVDGLSGGVDGVDGVGGGGRSRGRFDLAVTRSHSHLLSSPWL